MAPALEVIIDCNRCTSDRLRAAKKSSDLLSSMKVNRTQPSVPISWLGKGRPHNPTPHTTPNIDISSSYLKVKAFARADEPIEGAAPRTIGAINLPGHSMGVASRAASSVMVHRKAYPQPAASSKETYIQEPEIEPIAPVTPTPKVKIAVNVPSRALSGEVPTPNVPKPSPVDSTRRMNDLCPPHSIDNATAKNSVVLPALSKLRTSSPETIQKPARLTSGDSKLKTSQVRAGVRPAHGDPNATRVSFSSRVLFEFSYLSFLYFPLIRVVLVTPSSGLFRSRLVVLDTRHWQQDPS